MFSLQEFFDAFHKDKDYVKKFLKPLYIGDAEEYQQSELVTDFVALRKTAEKMVLESTYKLDLDATNPVFGVSDKARLKPVSSATEIS